MLALFHRVPRILISAFPLLFVSLLLGPILGEVPRTNPSAAQARAPRLPPKQLGPEAARQGDLDAPGVVEAEGGPFTVAEEKYLNRAWPGDEVPLDASLAAASVFRDVASRHDDDERMDFDWKALGPTNALYPAILGRTGAPYVSSGRITDLAIDPNCGEDRCRLWVAAAGGGVWRTDNALSDDARDFDWKWISGPLGSNAIGSLLVDPNDRTGNTLYVGTGEPNASVDSEAGLGIYKSTDGGDTWTRLPAVATVVVSGAPVVFPNFPKGRSVASLAVDPKGAIYVALARGVRGLNATDGGAVSTPPPAQNPAPVGLYKSTDGGSTFSRVWDGSTTLRGANEVRVDPRDGSTVYASAFQVGIWRSSGGAPFVQIFMPTSPTGNSDRTQFALTVKDGHTRIYAGDGSVGPDVPGSGFFESQVWRADKADLFPAAALLATQTAPVPGGWKKLTRSAVADPGYATYDFCTGQCWYDSAVVTPPGQPDTLFVLGSFQYNEAFTFTNARAVVRSLTAGEPDPAHNNRTFTDLTFDGTSATAPNSIHPDQHAIVFVPGRPGIWFEGSDGGLMRSSGRYVDASAQCDSRTHFDGTPLTPDQLITCKRLLSSIPSRFTNMNFGLNTIQFQMLSAHPKRPRSSLLGGTQDNGTFAFTGSTVTWKQTGGGDGGFSGYNVARPNFRLRTNFGQHVHGTRRGNDPAGWYHIGGPIFFSPEGSYFYMPIIYDPSPKAADTIYAGSFGVWRTQDNGGDPAFLEAHCQSLSVGERPFCGDFVELGGTAGRLTGAARGTRPGGAISVLARTPSDTNTLWAATGAGRVFISTNADGPAAAVTYKRLDTLAANSPPRFVSGIVVDPSNPFHAWISYSGYSGAVAAPGAEPNKPGHVFEIDYDGVTATWVPLDDGMGPMGDLPVDSIARDDATGDLFVSTDFGVLRQPAGTTHWHVAGSGLPPVEVPWLTLSQSGRVLYAATHGRGGYRLLLHGASGDDGDHGDHGDGDDD